MWWRAYVKTSRISHVHKSLILYISIYLSSMKISTESTNQLERQVSNFICSRNHSRFKSLWKLHHPSAKRLIVGRTKRKVNDRYNKKWKFDNSSLRTVSHLNLTENESSESFLVTDKNNFCYVARFISWMRSSKWERRQTNNNEHTKTIHIGRIISIIDLLLSSCYFEFEFFITRLDIRYCRNAQNNLTLVLKALVRKFRSLI